MIKFIIKSINPMSYLLQNPYFYNSDSVHSAKGNIRQYSPQITYSDYKSNRMTRKGQLIEEESMLRRLKVTSQIESVHREEEISAMRIKYQLQAMNLKGSEGQGNKMKLSEESKMILEENRMEFAVIEGCRNVKKDKDLMKGHAFPSYISSVRK